ncbi:f3dfdf58-ab21-4972-817f-469e6503dc26 [Sclerotinia trifoliorum]|uniref:F3dfdf58-ab21-4972-817f-469e6503dc26 n=1 Tax=Sclerotinia trifoliorum TaxID=28548 RepID=A0A8H2ZQ62_9HELO|nr:f3dfdf58-ab21-4972-817f-469e6503dc26 [Sclerotinia trifoliorum]
MLGADNIIDITFGVVSVILTVISIYLTCRQHTSREPDVEHGTDFEVKSIIPDPGTASIPLYTNVLSFPVESDQTIKSTASYQQPDSLSNADYYDISSEASHTQHQIATSNLQSSPNFSSGAPNIQYQIPSPTVQWWSDTPEGMTTSESPASHTHYHHSLRSFIIKELE